MHVSIDESRRDQLVAGIYLMVDRAFEAFTNEHHVAAFIDQLGIAPEMPTFICHQPAAGDAGTHGSDLRVPNESALTSIVRPALLRQAPIADWLEEDRAFLIWRDR